METYAEAAARLLRTLDERSKNRTKEIDRDVPRTVGHGERQRRRSVDAPRFAPKLAANNDNCGQFFRTNCWSDAEGPEAPYTPIACPLPDADPIASDLRSRVLNGYVRGNDE